ncbi:MAG: hypothetical protein ACTTIO_05665 [Candidatus Fimenecus sp.]
MKQNLLFISVFIILISITVFVIIKASKAVALRNKERDKTFREIERLKKLKNKFQNADKEIFKTADPIELLDGIWAAEEAFFQKSENADEAFENMHHILKHLYVMHCFFEDIEISLSFFFKNNSINLTENILPAFKAFSISCGFNELEKEFSMYDTADKNLYLIFDEQKILDSNFSKNFDKEKAYENIKIFILKHYDKIHEVLSTL